MTRLLLLAAILLVVTLAWRWRPTPYRLPVTDDLDAEVWPWLS